MMFLNRYADLPFNQEEYIKNGIPEEKINDSYVDIAKPKVEEKASETEKQHPAPGDDSDKNTLTENNSVNK